MRRCPITIRQRSDGNSHRSRLRAGHGVIGYLDYPNVAKVIRDPHVVRRVREHHPSFLIRHQNGKALGVKRAGAHQPMLIELPNITRLGNSHPIDFGQGIHRFMLGCFVRKQNVDFRRFKTSDVLRSSASSGNKLASSPSSTTRVSRFQPAHSFSLLSASMNTRFFVVLNRAKGRDVQGSSFEQRQVLARSGRSRACPVPAAERTCHVRGLGSQFDPTVTSAAHRGRTRDPVSALSISRF